MRRRASFFTVAVAIVLSAAAPARTASADVNVISTKLVTGVGHYYVSPPLPGFVDSQPTTFTETPFPNDASNHVTVDDIGLHILVNQVGVATAKPVQSNYIALDNWSSKSFEIVFQLDQPATYKYHTTVPPGQLAPRVTPTRLSGPGGTITFQAPDFVAPLDAEGVLQPGVYTFSGSGGFTSMPPIQGIVQAVTSGFKDTTLDVIVPEPGSAAGVLAGAMLMTARRGRRRVHP